GRRRHGGLRARLAIGVLPVEHGPDGDRGDHGGRHSTFEWIQLQRSALRTASSSSDTLKAPCSCAATLPRRSIVKRKGSLQTTDFPRWEHSPHAGICGRTPLFASLSL